MATYTFELIIDTTVLETELLLALPELAPHRGAGFYIRTEPPLVEIVVPDDVPEDAVSAVLRAHRPPEAPPLQVPAVTPAQAIARELLALLGRPDAPPLAAVLAALKDLAGGAVH